MQLTDEQKLKVHEWIGSGLKLSEIQDLLDKEFSIRMTYMDVRLLADDLKVTPKDKEEPKKPAEEPSAVPAEAIVPDEVLPGEIPPAGGIKVVVDQITRAGAVVSGKVTFRDGKTAEWYLDQMGRFGMVPPEPGYRPAQADLAEFQVVLERELARLGL
jgi:hypothetical protein